MVGEHQSCVDNVTKLVIILIELPLLEVTGLEDHRDGR